MLIGAAEETAGSGREGRVVSKRKSMPKIDGAGLDVHGAEPISHQVTIRDADGNPDIEFNFSFHLTPKRRAQLAQMLEEAYSEHDAYVLLMGGEILDHIRNKAKAAKS
jgi:hypothetical protein